MQILIFILILFTVDNSEELSTDSSSELMMLMNIIPKGGDLHNHLLGSLFFEDYINIYTKFNFCVDNITLQVSKNYYSENCKSFKDLDINLYNEIRKSWSLQEYIPKQQNVEKFFDIYKYLKLPLECTKEALLIIKNRAIKENVQYIELMIGVNSFIKLDNKCNKSFEFQDLHDLIVMFEKDYIKQTKINQSVKLINSYNISDDNFKIKYILTISRSLCPYLFVEEVYFASKIFNKTIEVVGINSLQREDNKSSLFYFNLQMKILKAFKYLNLNLKISLHSGELNTRITRPENLDHILTSINVGDRIGHGCDIMYEPNPINILKKMQKNKIAVEINLSSNLFLLGISPIDNPVKLYMKNNVPVVLGSDDSGILMTTLSEQYYLLMKNFNLNFSELKNIIYNGIHYSFLNSIEKEEQIKILDQKFIEFETKLIQYTD